MYIAFLILLNSCWSWKLKEEIEFQTGQTLDDLTAVEYRSQIVSRVNYVVKVCLHSIKIGTSTKREYIYRKCFFIGSHRLHWFHSFENLPTPAHALQYGPQIGRRSAWQDTPRCFVHFLRKQKNYNVMSKIQVIKSCIFCVIIWLKIIFYYILNVDSFVKE